MRRPDLHVRTRSGTPARLLPVDDRWLIHSGADAGAAVGFVRARPDGRQAEIDFALDEAARGRGLASAAVAAVSRFMLDPDGGDADVLLWRAQVGNWAARRVVWSCGYRVEGQVRGLIQTAGGVTTGWIGALVRGEPTVPLPWLEPPELVVGDVLLRANTLADLPRMVEACSDPLTQLFLPLLPDPYGDAEARWFLAWLAEEQASAMSLGWAIATVDEPGTLCGQVGLHKLAGGTSAEGEIGYWVHPDSRHLGLARVALRAVARHALLPEIEGGLGLRRVLVRAADPNTGSVRVIRTAGFREVGRDRAAERLRDGRVVDLLRFDLLAAELDEAWAHPSALR